MAANLRVFTSAIQRLFPIKRSLMSSIPGSLLWGYLMRTVDDSSVDTSQESPRGRLGAGGGGGLLREPEEGENSSLHG